jgi:hypothetical protein
MKKQSGEDGNARGDRSTIDHKGSVISSLGGRCDWYDHVSWRDEVAPDPTRLAVQEQAARAVSEARS